MCHFCKVLDTWFTLANHGWLFRPQRVNKSKYVLSYNRIFNITVLMCSFHRSAGRKVVLGVHSLSEPEETKQTFDILEYYNHPDFNVLNYDNDIALIKVNVYVYV